MKKRIQAVHKMQELIWERSILSKIMSTEGLFKFLLFQYSRTVSKIAFNYEHRELRLMQFHLFQTTVL